MFAIAERPMAYDLVNLALHLPAMSVDARPGQRGSKLESMASTEVCQRGTSDVPEAWID